MNADGQIGTFVITVATGVFLGLVFDFYRVLRALFRLRRLWTALADLVYWLFATVAFFLALLLGNWGELRLYAFIGLAFGAFAYFRLLSRHCVRGLVGLIRLMATVVRVVITVVHYTVIKPAGYLIGLIIRPLRRFGGKIADGRRSPPDNFTPPR
jgi:spore cortex biosynthesis protein YabQ